MSAQPYLCDSPQCRHNLISLHDVRPQKTTIKLRSLQRDGLICVEWSMESSKWTSDINVRVNVRELICGHVIRVCYGQALRWCKTYYLFFQLIVRYVRSRVNRATIDVPQVEHRTTQAVVLFPVSRPNKRVAFPSLLIFTWALSQVSNPWTARTCKG
jgi:hypothetical protein